MARDLLAEHHVKTLNFMADMLANSSPAMASALRVEAARPQPKIVTEFVYPPIPFRRCDWSATLDGYEPGEPIGWGRTEIEAIADLREQLAERAA